MTTEQLTPTTYDGNVYDLFGNLEQVEPSDVFAQLPRQWRVLHDTPWPGRAGSTIDHILVGPAGLVAVMRGDVPTTALAAAAALSALVPGLPHEYVHAVLVVAGADATSVDCEGVTCCEEADLPALVRSLPTVIRGEEAVGVLGVLYVGLERVEQAEKAENARQAAAAETAHAEEAATAGPDDVAVPAHRRHRSWLGARSVISAG